MNRETSTKIQAAVQYPMPLPVSGSPLVVTMSQRIEVRAGILRRRWICGYGISIGSTGAYIGAVNGVLGVRT
ncbi:hypothetical protein AQUCO_00400339v1 [Aquilegia coerulea]|uniref:Uncharacterized protein n=1 Tax=Aquilegia coerulea TaxID=218851 RepID=A0A2G5EUG1_AQUCA|nr:hypothetical protein AQUCO_00400339v1 [Aquilegia coerulea]